MEYQEKRSYLEQTIMPVFANYVERRCNSAIWDSECRLVIATNFFAKFLGYQSWKELQNVSYWHATVDTLPIAVPNQTVEHIKSAISLMHKSAEIIQFVLNEGSPINAIVLHPFYESNAATAILQYLPIIHPSGECVGVLVYSVPFQLFGIQEYINRFSQKPVKFQPKIVLDPTQLPIALTEHQLEVIFLLAIGLSQRDAAELLLISRGTLSKMVTDVLCPKFAISPPNTTDLINKAQQLGLHNCMPLSLRRPWIIIMRADYDLEIKHGKFSSAEIWKEI